MLPLYEDFLKLSLQRAMNFAIIPHAAKFGFAPLLESDFAAAVLTVPLV